MEMQVATPFPRLIAVCVVLMGVMLNQVGVVLGVNFSAADLFMFALFGLLLTARQIHLPLFMAVFFLVTSVSVLVAANFVVPITFGLDIQPMPTLIAYLKLVVGFVYFLMGLNLQRLGLIAVVIKAFALTALAVSVSAIALPSAIVSSYFSSFYTYARLQGLMGDPNYFAVIQAAALAYFLATKSLGKFVTLFAVLMLVSAVIASGSKTGLATLIVFCGFKFVEALMRRDVPRSHRPLRAMLMISIATSSVMILNLFRDVVIEMIVSRSGGFTRVADILGDLGVAVSAAGSNRDDFWSMGAGNAVSSPLVGVGVGSPVGVIAHNTYLQIASEWGLPLAVFALAYAFRAVGRCTLYTWGMRSDLVVSRDIALIIALGSMGLSLNNARLMWLVLGSIAFAWGGAKPSGGHQDTELPGKAQSSGEVALELPAVLSRKRARQDMARLKGTLS